MKIARLPFALALVAFAAFPAAAQDAYEEEYEDEAFAEDEAHEGEHGHDGEHNGEHAEGEHAEGDHAEGAHAEGHEGGHGEAHGIDVPYMAATVFNFVIWLGIVVFIFRKPLGTFLTNRRVHVVEGLEEAKRLKAEADQKHKEYSERLAHLDEELEKLRKEMIQAGEAERDRIIAEAETRAARMRRDANFVVEQQMKQLRTDLTNEAIVNAVFAAERVLREHTKENDQERLAKDYLAKLEAKVKEDDEEVRA
jgi:F-type H+-transporting ATPase subunit b